jgi:cancer susceptibility candidate protein 1
MRCDGLPNANDPADLRKYIHIWLESMREYDRKEENWLLRTKEQSILTQDSKVPNLSVACLKKQQPNIGDMYAKKAKEVLGILDEIEDVIEEGHVKKSILEDLMQVTQYRP